MKKSIWTLSSLALAASLSLGSCTEAGSKTGAAEVVNNAVDTVKQDSVAAVAEPVVEAVVEKVAVDRKYDDVARILAGMSIDEASEFYEVTQGAAWKAYAKKADQGWASADAKRFDELRTWAGTELAGLNEMKGDLFYPFSGPDIYYGYQFFPSAKNYHLFALEPAGNLTFMKSDDVNWMNYCNSVQNTIADFIRGGFFHTKHMKVDMARTGVLPTLLVFLVRSGNKIVNVRPVAIQADGSVAVLEGSNDFSSVRVDFLDAKTQEQKTLFYHSSDVLDAGLEKRPELYKHLETVAANRTFTKSASYLMHRPTFTKVRELILAKAKAVFQDDTAIPYHYYNSSEWDFTFYGQYTSPIPLFKVRYQSELREVYKTQKIKDLPFSLGYHSTREHDNMMIAKRKN